MIARQQERKPVVFYYASTPLLLALFQEDATKKIQEKEFFKWQEKRRHSPLTKEELEELFFANFKEKTQKIKVEALIDFSRKTQVNPDLYIKDKATGISIKKPYFSK
jgi:hypothetical protein